jgi:hypothetical protein
MSDTSKAILLVADISGFANFMKLHALSTNHAKQIVVRLLLLRIFKQAFVFEYFLSRWSRIMSL